MIQIEKWRLYKWFCLPFVQVVLLSIITLCSPGMFNAINGMGGAGQLEKDVEVVSKANAVLYALFAIVGLIAGGINNVLGPRATLFIGSTGYLLYVGALFAYNSTRSSAFMISAGAYLGICAALLWAAQGQIMMSYPDERNKGRYIGVFWMIFNFGAVIGALAVLAFNFKKESSGAVTNVTYIGIMLVISLGVVLTLVLVPPHRVRRRDGSTILLAKHPYWRDELVAITKLMTNRRLLLLFPLFFTSNFFYSYQLHINGFYFSVRTRALNNTFYWFAQIVGALAFGVFLDSGSLSRRRRAYFGLAFVGIAFSATWCAALFWQLTFSKGTKQPEVDWESPHFAEKFFVYVLFGICDSVFQVYCYWLMGAMSNDSMELSRYAGFYKGIQSAGGAISWAIDASSISFLGELLLNWALLLFSLPMAFLVCRSITDTNYTDDDTLLPSQIDEYALSPASWEDRKYLGKA
ncbi:uncharacterized protein VTP21DRAFT_7423 [Calcarisporiella thermophila]|uniref:uncharacterized protein n=1 Tax=Calcarisporiella thermophila TaxID=911321 RepID=UPI0037445055